MFYQHTEVLKISKIGGPLFKIKFYRKYIYSYKDQLKVLSIRLFWIEISLDLDVVEQQLTLSNDRQSFVNLASLYFLGL